MSRPLLFLPISLLGKWPGMAEDVPPSTQAAAAAAAKASRRGGWGGGGLLESVRSGFCLFVCFLFV